MLQNITQNKNITFKKWIPSILARILAPTDHRCTINRPAFLTPTAHSEHLFDQINFSSLSTTVDKITVTGKTSHPEGNSYWGHCWEVDDTQNDPQLPSCELFPHGVRMIKRTVQERPLGAPVEERTQLVTDTNALQSGSAHLVLLLKQTQGLSSHVPVNICRTQRRLGRKSCCLGKPALR